MATKTGVEVMDTNELKLEMVLQREGHSDITLTDQGLQGWMIEYADGDVGYMGNEELALWTRAAIAEPAHIKIAQPRFAVGDRFAYGGSHWLEIVAITNGKHLYELRANWHDKRGHYSENGLLAFYTHISGPTYRAPLAKPKVTCNCSAQVTAGPCRDWCRTQGTQ